MMPGDTAVEASVYLANLDSSTWLRHHNEFPN